MADDKPDDTKLETASNESSLASRADLVYWVEYHGDSIELRGGQLLVGRSAMCRLVLDDPLVSRQHAEFRVENGVVVLHDLKSVNGVFVNGQKIGSEEGFALVDGDHISIGNYELIFRSSLAENTSQYGRDAEPSAQQEMTQLI